MLVGPGLTNEKDKVRKESHQMKKIIAVIALVIAAALFTAQPSALAQSQGARTEYVKPKPRKVQRDYRYVDTSCHTFGGYGWGPYFGPCPYRGQVYYAQPGPPVFGPFLPMGPYW
jgi:hypothetical protein